MILDRNQQLYTEQKNNCHENYFSLPPPPSYSTVIAEKQWTEKLDEINELLLTLRLSIQDIYFMMTMYRHYYQRVELKSQYLLDMLKKKSPHSPLRKARSSSSCNVLSSQSIETVQVDDDDDEEREEEALITRMNQTVSYLIREAEVSLAQNTVPTVIQLDTDEDDCIFHRLQQQKKRYLYSQYTLTMTMNRLIQYAKTSSFREDASTKNNNVQQAQQQQQQQQQQHSNTCHYHYHYHYHYPLKSEHATTQDTPKKDTITMTTTPLYKDRNIANSQVTGTLHKHPPSSSLSHPLHPLSKTHTNHGYDHQTRHHRCLHHHHQHHHQPYPKRHRPQLYRLLFFATLVLLYNFHPHYPLFPYSSNHMLKQHHVIFEKRLWLRRKSLLMNTWKAKRLYLYQWWILKSNLFLYIVRLLLKGH